jgi:hypothetical protein
MSTTISTTSLDVTKNALGLLIATGGTAPYAWELTAGRLPPGLSFTSDGRVVGAARAHGTASITVRCTDSGTAAGSALNDQTNLNTPDATGRTAADGAVTVTY